MLSFEDSRWNALTAGYRTRIDLRPILQRLEFEQDAKQAWDELWQELYHQGDVGEGSFVAVPRLVRIHRLRGVPDWNTYALTARIEIARGKDGNPDVPAWSRESYDEALRELGQLGWRNSLALRTTTRFGRFSGSSRSCTGTHVRAHPGRVHRGGDRGT